MSSILEVFGLWITKLITTHSEGNLNVPTNVHLVETYMQQLSEKNLMYLSQK